MISLGMSNSGEQKYSSNIKNKKMSEKYQIVASHMEKVKACRFAAEQNHIEGNHEQAEQCLIAAREYIVIAYFAQKEKVNNDIH